MLTSDLALNSLSFCTISCGSPISVLNSTEHSWEEPHGIVMYTDNIAWEVYATKSLDGRRMELFIALKRTGERGQGRKQKLSTKEAQLGRRGAASSLSATTGVGP